MSGLSLSLGVIAAAAALDGGSAGRIAATRVVDPTEAPGQLDAFVDAVTPVLKADGFQWREEACGLQPEPLACLRSLQPKALLFVTLARVDGLLVLTVADKEGLVARLDAPAAGRRLAEDFLTFLRDRYAARAAGVIRSRAALPTSAEVTLDGRRLGRASGGARLELDWVQPGAHQLELSAPNRESPRLELEVAPGEVTEVELRMERLRSGSRVLHLMLGVGALAAGASLFAVGVGDSNCDIISDRPVGRCPDAFRPDVDLRIPGAGAFAFGAGLVSSELLLDRRKSAWLPLLLGLATGGVATAAAFAGY